MKEHGHSLIFYIIFCQILCVLSRTFTIVNQCSTTIWPAYYTDPNSPQINYQTGWEAKSCSSVSFDVPTQWSGRMWARTECSSNGTCATGSCVGGIVCSASTGNPPVTLGEWTLAATGFDNYDISLVDGFSLPLAITTTVSCPAPSCPTDFVATGCPDPSLQIKDTLGNVVACDSACTALNTSLRANSPICCTGSYATPANCPASGVPFYSQYKTGCPAAYAYAYDDSTSLSVCPAQNSANYKVVWCPNTSCGNNLDGMGSTTNTTAIPGATGSSESKANQGRLTTRATGYKPIWELPKLLSLFLAFKDLVAFRQMLRIPLMY